MNGCNHDPARFRHTKETGRGPGPPAAPRRLGPSAGRLRDPHQLGRPLSGGHRHSPPHAGGGLLSGEADPGAAIAAGPQGHRIPGSADGGPCPSGPFWPPCRRLLFSIHFVFKKAGDSAVPGLFSFSVFSGPMGAMPCSLGPQALVPGGKAPPDGGCPLTVSVSAGPRRRCPPLRPAQLRAPGSFPVFYSRIAPRSPPSPRPGRASPHG